MGLLGGDLYLFFLEPDPEEESGVGSDWRLIFADTLLLFQRHLRSGIEKEVVRAGNINGLLCRILKLVMNVLESTYDSNVVGDFG